MKSKYYKRVSLDGNEYIIKTIDPNAPQNFSHSNARIVLINNQPPKTRGWFRIYSNEDFESFEALDTAEAELQLQMSKHLVN